MTEDIAIFFLFRAVTHVMEWNDHQQEETEEV
jgi:hypothetical protein